MHYVVTLKVYNDTENVHDKAWYRVKNGKEVIDLDICCGDKMLIDGIGNLEVFGVDYESREKGKNPYRSLTITCGLVIS